MKKINIKKILRNLVEFPQPLKSIYRKLATKILFNVKH